VTGQTGTTDDAKMLAVRDSTYQEEVEDEAYAEKVVVPGTVTNDDPPNNGVPSQTGAKDVAKRPAMPTAASEKRTVLKTDRPTAWQARWRPRSSP
jgi:hypothetical protein